MRHNIYKKRGVCGAEVDKDRCRERTLSGEIQSHQCTRKPKVFEDVELPDGTVECMGFCKQHSREVREEKERRLEAELAEERVAWRRSSDLREVKDQIIDKVVELAIAKDGPAKDLIVGQLRGLASRLKKLRGES